MNPDLIKGLIVLGVATLFTVIAFFLKRLFFDPLHDHIQECNKVPKSLLLEKIDNLTDKVAEHQDYVKEMRTEFRGDINKLATSLNSYVTRQNKFNRRKGMIKSE